MLKTRGQIKAPLPGVQISSYYLGRLTHRWTVGEKGKSMVKSKPIRKAGKAQTARIRNKSFIPVIIQKTFLKCEVNNARQ